MMTMNRMRNDRSRLKAVGIDTAQIGKRIQRARDAASRMELTANAVSLVRYDRNADHFRGHVHIAHGPSMHAPTLLRTRFLASSASSADDRQHQDG
jgi:hypothetical protein